MNTVASTAGLPNAWSTSPPGGIATQEFLLALRTAALAPDYLARSRFSEPYVEYGKRARVFLYIVCREVDL